MKNGFLFSLDAVIAITLLLSIAVFLAGLSVSYSSPELRYQKLYYMGKDLLNVLEQVKLKNVKDLETVRDYLSRGILKEEDLNRTLIDIIGSFAVGNETQKEYAKNLTRELFSKILPENFGYGIYINGETVYNSSNEGNFVSTLSTISSGYEIGKPVYGFVSRSFLTGISGKTTSAYAYFGGFVGQGNISRNITLPENLSAIQEVYMELDSGGNFTLYVNGNNFGTYEKGSSGGGYMRPDKWVICNSSYNPSYCSLTYFHSGNNTIQFNFTGDNITQKYIGGGYFKIKYNTSKAITTQSLNKYWFPGIYGIINLYSSFYIPGTLNSMKIRLHYKTQNPIFLNIGNATIYESNLTQQDIIIDNSSIYGNLTLYGLNYNFLSNKTIPLRLGTRNVSHMSLVGEGIGDAVLITDVSGSMNDCAEYSQPLTCSYTCLTSIFPWRTHTETCIVNSEEECTNDVCEGGCIATWGHELECNRTKLDFAKEADKEFVAVVLNKTGNKVGLVSYSTNVVDSHNLSTNETSLNNQIDGYSAGGSTCICCGINEGKDILEEQSNPNRRRALVVMSDGEANEVCSEQGTGDAKQDAIQAGCDARENGIIVYSVGFGSPGGDLDELTLKKIACWNCSANDWLEGESEENCSRYWYSNATELAETFREIAENFINISYNAQTINASGGILNSILYPDSYIEFNYTPFIPKLEYGELSITTETPRFGNNITNGTFYIPSNVRILDAKITSYSSQWWTDRFWVKNQTATNWTMVYWLGDYGQNYTDLGDPYIIQIPTNLLVAGENNSVKIGTALAPELNETSNATKGGSPDDEVIYTIGLKLSVPYNQTLPKAEGCIWHLVFEDGSETTLYAPSDYSGSKNCYFEIGDYDKNDTIDDSVYRLLLQLDTNQNGKIDIKFDPSQFSIKSVSLGGITSLWGPAKIEIRVWI